MKRSVSVVSRRVAALAALVLAMFSLVLLGVVVTANPARGAVGLGLLLLAAFAAWHGVTRHGTQRVAGLGTGILLLAAQVSLLVAGHPALVLGSMAALAGALVAGSNAFRIHVSLPEAPRPAHPVLFCNPRSGGGKVARSHLVDEARARGIEPVELTPGTDLERVVRAAVEQGADALAMAGGDGSQATVACIAAERGIPFACVPAGTRNHFALDLGVDRDDVVGALDALVDGGERVVDLGEVNGRTFVNNVSLGLYGEAVQRAGYRDAKVETLLATVPDAADPKKTPDLRWDSPDGKEHEGAVAIVVSNNAYRLGHVMGDGTRPRLDGGVLGVAVLAAPGDEPGARTWSTPSFELHTNAPVHAGIDGEAVVLDPPVRFHVRPAALRCRIARRHPGASPSAFLPDTPWAVVSTLIRIVAGHDPRPLAG
jgi:diacylglycerol kinase family enzyme